jgi:hypothetical protein
MIFGATLDRSRSQTRANVSVTDVRNYIALGAPVRLILQIIQGAGR